MCYCLHMKGKTCLFLELALYHRQVCNQVLKAGARWLPSAAAFPLVPALPRQLSAQPQAKDLRSATPKAAVQECKGCLDHSELGEDNAKSCDHRLKLQLILPEHVLTGKGWIPDRLKRDRFDATREEQTRVKGGLYTSGISLEWQTSRFLCCFPNGFS